MTTSPGIDPGFTNRGGGAIFKFEYSQGLETADGRWEMPDHTQVERNIGCSLAMSNTVTHSESEESNEMAVSVSVEAEASGWGFEGSFSADVKYSAPRRTARPPTPLRPRH